MAQAMVRVSAQFRQKLELVSLLAFLAICNGAAVINARLG
jgi:hypothetical protein